MSIFEPKGGSLHEPSEKETVFLFELTAVGLFTEVINPEIRKQSSQFGAVSLVCQRPWSSLHCPVQGTVWPLMSWGWGTGIVTTSW